MNQDEIIKTLELWTNADTTEIEQRMHHNLVKLYQARAEHIFAQNGRTCCMLCDGVTTKPVESKRPSDAPDLWGATAIMVCPKCRGSQSEIDFWYGLGDWQKGEEQL